MRAGSTDAERAVEAKSAHRGVWRRLKEAGARANGLSGLSGEFDPGQAVAKRFARDVLDEAEARADGDALLPVEVGLEEEDNAYDGGQARDGGQDKLDDCRVAGTNYSGDRDDESEQLAPGGAVREGQQFPVEREGAMDDLHWIAHGGRSLRITAFAAIALLVASVLNPSGFSVDGLVLGAVLYVVWLGGGFWAVCQGCGRGHAVFPEKSGAVRLALSAVALAFLWSGDPAAAGLAVWIAATAVAIGGLDDGDWIAVICLRREVPPWRAVAAVFRESRHAWREGWRVLYGGTFR